MFKHGEGFVFGQGEAFVLYVAASTLWSSPMKPPFPILSILAWLSAAFFYVASAIYWDSVVQDRIEATEFNSADAEEDAGRFSSLEVLFRAMGTAAVGALVGVGLSIAAHRRREAVPTIRYLAMVGNVAYLGYTLILSPAIYASFSSGSP